MKKILLALVCATMSLSLMAQSQDKNDKNQPCMDQPRPGMQWYKGFPGPQMRPMESGDISILKKIGVDSTKIKQVKELKKENRKALLDLKKKYREDVKNLKAEYNSNLRKVLGDDTYIKYLEAKVAQNQFKAPRHNGMNRMGKPMGRNWRPMGPRMQPHHGRPGQQGPQPSCDKKDSKDKNSKDSKDSKDKKASKDKKSKKANK